MKTILQVNGRTYRVSIKQGEIVAELMAHHAPTPEQNYIAAQSQGIGGDCIDMQIQCPNSKTNWLRITPKQARQIFALLMK